LLGLWASIVEWRPCDREPWQGPSLCL
jgi:hypothetical protein